MIFVDFSFILLQPNRSQLRLLTRPKWREGQGGSRCYYSLHSWNCLQTQSPQALTSLKTTGGPTVCVAVGTFWLLSQVIFSLLLAVNICLTFKERLTFKLLSSYKMQDLLLNCWQIWNRCHVKIDIKWWWHFSKAFPNSIFKVHVVKWNN